MSKSVATIPVAFIEGLNSIPLWFSLANELTDHSLKPQIVTPNEGVRLLSEGIIDIAEIPAVELARSKQSWKLVPGTAVVSNGRCNCASLFFAHGLKEINTLAVPAGRPNESVLLQIVLSEKFSMHPDIIEREQIDPEKVTEDAYLLVGDQARRYNIMHENYFDLCEEWFDMTELPFVHSVVALRDFLITEREAQMVKTSVELGRRKLEDIAKHFEDQNGGDWKDYHDHLSQNLRFVLDEKAQDGMSEFYSYAFFYGLADFVPDLKFMSL